MQEQLKKLKEKRDVCHICKKLHKTRDCWYFLKSYAQGMSQQGHFLEQVGNFSGQGSNFLGNNGNFWRQDKNFAKHDRNHNDHHVPRFNRSRDRRNHRPHYRNYRRSLNRNGVLVIIFLIFSPHFHRTLENNFFFKFI